MGTSVAFECHVKVVRQREGEQRIGQQGRHGASAQQSWKQDVLRVSLRPAMCLQYEKAEEEWHERVAVDVKGIAQLDPLVGTMDGVDAKVLLCNPPMLTWT